jgi:hypothetical protein
MFTARARQRATREGPEAVNCEDGACLLDWKRITRVYMVDGRYLCGRVGLAVVSVLGKGGQPPLKHALGMNKP